MTVRICTGYWKGTKLEITDQPGLRPTPAKTRETLANWLRPHTSYNRIVDLFAGSGALGLELCSIAMPATQPDITFVDNNKEQIHRLHTVSNKLQLNARIITANAIDFLATTRESFDMILADPPFDMTDAPHIAKYIDQSQATQQGAMIYLEYRRHQQPHIPQHWITHKHTCTGQTCAGLWIKPPLPISYQ